MKAALPLTSFATLAPDHAQAACLAGPGLSLRWARHGDEEGARTQGFA